MMQKIGRRLAGTAVSAFLSLAGLLRPLPRKRDLHSRLASFPRHNLPLRQLVNIRWNDHQIPFIEAENDDDLAVALGLVHAHLRLGQIELFRHITQGRLAELAGPVAIDLDHTLRILDFQKGGRATLAEMRPSTRRWIDHFVDGINHYLMSCQRLPHEYELFGLKRQPFTALDIAAGSRLGSIDVNWVVWFSLLEQRTKPGWKDHWQDLLRQGTASIESFRPVIKEAALAAVMETAGRSGSNAVAISGSRTASGSALLAGDPHLGLSLPNLWLICGMRSPSYHQVGFMIPGIPFVAVGRNRSIAWAGTNMRSASSDLVDVSGSDETTLSRRSETLGVRGWGEVTVEVRESQHGPVLSDAPLIRSHGETFALKWTGHRGCQDITAMLDANRASTFVEFRDALSEFGAGGQNFLYADSAGHIGQVLAVQLPARDDPFPDDMIQEPQSISGWDTILNAADLPCAYDPSSGFIGSANNKPTDCAVPIGWFFSDDDRIERLERLFKNNTTVTLDDLRAAHGDVVRPSALEARDMLVMELAKLDQKALGVSEVLNLLATWDGCGDATSRPMLAFEVLIHHLSEALHTNGQIRLPDNLGSRPRNVRRGLAIMDTLDRRSLLLGACAVTADTLKRHRTWGDIHRLRVQHLLGNLPLVGYRYRYADLPADGSTTTLHKTAHAGTDKRHYASYGAQARHISDMADIDANWFVLFGGQDGWLGSSTFRDQVDLWRASEYIQVPLSRAAVERDFPHSMDLGPHSMDLGPHNIDLGPHRGAEVCDGSCGSVPGRVRDSDRRCGG